SSNSDIDDLFSDSQCKVCSAVLISESQKLAHYQSKKHESKVRRYMSIHGNEEPIAKRFKPSGDVRDKYKVCSVCNMTFSSPVVAQSHYQGKVHSKNLRLKTFGQQTPASTLKGYPCTVCNIELNSVEQYQAHISGSKHKNQ
uniref:Zinc finger protein 346 n=1 Tax=Cyprinus carpio TaxID=7962 RepID=A0A8C2Q253_CYPCA